MESKLPSNKKSKSEKKKNSKVKTKKSTSTSAADRADRYQLYQDAVQSAENEIGFFKSTYKKLRGRVPLHLREDFCGTALVATEWVASHSRRSAEGYDHDPEPMEWGRARHVAELGKKKSRLKLFEDDVRASSERSPDIRAALNFSYFVFKDRWTLVDYFRGVRSDLADDGIFILDLWGGTHATQIIKEERPIGKGVRYVWDQAEYYPGTGDIMCHIRFRFRDGSKMKAFSYDWRYWSLPELREALHDAGFEKIENYFEIQEEDGEGTGEYECTDRGTGYNGDYIVYIVAQK